MGKVVVFTNVTLDGVMQAPGRPDEDRRGGFDHGGWATPYAAMSQAGGGTMFAGALLLGRRTYEDFYSVWPKRIGNPFTAVLNNMQKYVASRTLKEPLPWMNSTLLKSDANDGGAKGGDAKDGDAKGDAANAVARLKKESAVDLVVLGSGDLIQSLARRNLIDEYVLLIHPLVLGTGRRLFPDGASFRALRLVSTKTTTTGVVIATYQPAESAAGKTT